MISALLVIFWAYGCNELAQCLIYQSQAQCTERQESFMGASNQGLWMLWGFAVLGTQPNALYMLFKALNHTLCPRRLFLVSFPHLWTVPQL